MQGLYQMGAKMETNEQLITLIDGAVNDLIDMRAKMSDLDRIIELNTVISALIISTDRIGKRLRDKNNVGD